MTESMYDRLGDMLSQVLDTGILPPPVPAAGTQKTAAQIPAHIQKAFSQLEISADDSYEKAHTRYREKLQQYHPDKFEQNNSGKDFAVQKTKEIINAWIVARPWLKAHA